MDGCKGVPGSGSLLEDRESQASLSLDGADGVLGLLVVAKRTATSSRNEGGGGVAQPPCGLST